MYYKVQFGCQRKDSRGGLFAGEKRAINQGISASEGRNGCVFPGVLRQCKGIDLPRGIGVLESTKDLREFF